MLFLFSTIIIIVSGFATYSFIEYTTPNYFKAVYARSYIKNNGSYYMGESKYMILRKYTISDTFNQFLETIDGDSLEKVSKAATPFYVYNDNGDKKKIDVLVDTSTPGSYMIIKIVDY